MTDSVNLNDYDDPERPPAGYQAVECPDCSVHYRKPSPGTAKMSAGPIPGVSLSAGRAASLCTACRGRRWVWAPVPGTPHVH